MSACTFGEEPIETTLGVAGQPLARRGRAILRMDRLNLEPGLSVH